MITMQSQTTEELCNLLVQSLVAKDELLLQKVLEQEDETTIQDILKRVPVSHVRKLVIELSNLLSTKLSVNHLHWLQLLLAHKASVVSTMADGQSILRPLISLLEDKSSPDYYIKMQGLKGKLTLLKQLKQAKRSDYAETVVRVDNEPEVPAQMEIDSETESEEELEEEEEEDDIDGEDVDEEFEPNQEKDNLEEGDEVDEDIEAEDLDAGSED